MPNESSWTGAIRSIKLHSFTRVNIKGADFRHDSKLSRALCYYPLGSILTGVTPSPAFAPARRSSVNEVLGVHDLFMAAKCDTCTDYSSSIPDRSYLLGSLSFDRVDPTGRMITETVNLLFAPDVVWHREDCPADYFSGVRGLYYRGGLICKVGVGDWKSTLRHEMLHAIIHHLPELKEEMYGEDSVVQMEEIAVHVATDFFDKLSNLNGIELDVSKTTVSEDDRDEESPYGDLDYYSVCDIRSNGKSLLIAEINLDLSDAKEESQIVSERELISFKKLATELSSSFHHRSSKFARAKHIYNSRTRSIPNKTNSIKGDLNNHGKEN